MTQDTVFSWKQLAVRNNTELLNNLGNFINRTLVFLKTNFSRFVKQALHTNLDD